MPIAGPSHGRVAQLRASELGAVLARLRGGLIGIAALSAVINVLAVTSSIYLMLVYDRVLPSQRLATLLSVLFMVSIVYLFYAGFDMLRAHMLSDLGAAVDRAVSDRVQQLEATLALTRPASAERESPIRDLDQIRGFLASPGPAALIDLPWILFFLIILTLIHYWLGVVTLVGAIILAVLTVTTERVTKPRVLALNGRANTRRIATEAQRRHAEVIAGLGMRGRMAARWSAINARFLDAQTELAEKTATLAAVSRTFRLFLQSITLSVGAVLVIEGKASGGIIFASSILAGRALAPVDGAIANWRNFVSARQGWARLDRLFAEYPAVSTPAVHLPAPTRALVVEQLALAPPGTTKPVIAGVGLKASAGDAIGIVGPSASGKSSLLRGIIGVWAPLRGEVRLDGATIEQWDAEAIGAAIGYLPQAVELFDGTVAENIARFDPAASSDAVIAAARAAGVHDMIVALAEGYETRVGEDGLHLSAGQRQRIGLARALYRDPFLIVLDEPNSNLDPEGEVSLAEAIMGVRKRGGIVLVAAHRTSVLQAVNLVLVMRGGQVQAFGPRDEVLARLSGKPGPAAPPPPSPGPGGLSVVGRR